MTGKRNNERKKLKRKSFSRYWEQIEFAFDSKLFVSTIDDSLYFDYVFAARNKITNKTTSWIHNLPRKKLNVTFSNITSR